MAKQYDSLDGKTRDFLLRQHIFFTASATDTSRVNISPREIGALRILDDNTVVYLDRTGSGNETAAHMLADGRMTIMTCSFEGPPLILRLYGSGTAIPWGTDVFNTIIAEHYDGHCPLGARQLMQLKFDLVQTSCGYGVPLFSYEGERQAIENWHDAKGPQGVVDYWKKENLHSMDGLPTGIKLPDDG